MRYKFIALEGIDGSGKTSVKQMLFSLFTEKNKQPLSILPTSWLDPWATNVIVSAKYQGILYPKEIITEAYIRDKKLLYSHLVEPHLKYRPVISDRYLLSDFVYHKELYGIEPLITSQKYKENAVKEPDLLIFIDTDPEKAFDRIIKRNPNAINNWENPKMLSKLQSTFQKSIGFLECKKVFIKNNGSRIELEEQVYKIFSEILDD